MQQFLNKAVLILMGLRVLSTHAQPDPILIPNHSDLSDRTELSQPGFQIRLHQANEPLQNSVSERESVLTGTRPDFLGFPLENFANEASAQTVDWILGHTYAVEGPIDLDQAGNAAGEVSMEQSIPGIPGLDNGTDYITSEILMLLEIPEPGPYQFGIHASGGFTVRTGNINDLFEAILVAEVIGHQEASTTRFDLEFEQAGIYQFRTLWYTGEGNASFEWWTLNTEEQAVLLNSEGGLRTFSNQPQPLNSIVQSIPAPAATGVLLDQSTLEIQIQHDLPKLNNNSIAATLNGDPVTPQVQLAGDLLTLTINLSGLTPFTTYHWTLTFDVAGRTREIVGNLTTTVFGGEGLLFIEAEDFNFGGGEWEQLNPIGMTGPYPGGAYRDRGNGIDATDVGAGTDFGVDYFEDPSSNDLPDNAYRRNTGVETIVKIRSEDLFRGTFSVISNHVVTGTNEGEWLNYTREFQTALDGSKTAYNVFVRASSSDKPIHASLSLVTTDPETEELQIEPVALLNPGRATADGDTFELFSLRTPYSMPGEGDALATVELGGLETLRLTALAGTGHNLDYMVFLPAIASIEPGEIISFSRDGNSLIIEYTGILKNAAAITGEFLPVEGASSPYTVTPDKSQSFFIAE